MAQNDLAAMVLASIAVFVEGGVMGDGSTIIGGGNTNSNNADNGSPVLPEVDGSGGSIFAPSDPLVVSANASAVSKSNTVHTRSSQDSAR